MRRKLIVCATTMLVLLPMLVWLRTPAVATTKSCGATMGDFNRDGEDDLVVGIPEKDVGGKSNAGAVSVIYGGVALLAAGGTAAALPDREITQDSAGIQDQAEPGDGFGSALTVGDFNKDGYADLAVGAPFEDVDGVADTGGVNVIFGGSNGLGEVDFFYRLVDKGITPTSNDFLGIDLTACDFNADGYDDLAMGMRARKVGTQNNAGAVVVSYGNSARTFATNQLWTQDSNGITGAAEDADSFGWKTAGGDFNGDGTGDLAIGVRYETLESGVGAQQGAIHVIYGTVTLLKHDHSQFFSEQSLSGDESSYEAFGSTLATGDFNRDGEDDLAIGAPLETSLPGTFTPVGGVFVMYGTVAHLSSQGSLQIIQNPPVCGNAYGGGLAAGDLNGDGFGDLVIGAPGKDLDGNQENEGGLNVLYGTSGHSFRNLQVVTQDSANIDETAEPNEFFGDVVAVADFNGDATQDLAVGVPNEDVGTANEAGAVNVLYGNVDFVGKTADQLWHQNSSNVDGSALGGDHYGWALPFENWWDSGAGNNCIG